MDKNNDNKIVSSKVLEKISKEGIKPRPFWYFYLARFFLYFIAFLSLISGGLALAIVVYILNNQDYSLNNLFIFIPYAWLLTLFLLYFVIYYNFKQFPRAYRYSKKVLLIFVFLGSITLALLFSNFNCPKNLHNNFSDKSIHYRRVFDSNIHPWQRPEAGFLAGKILINNGDYLEVEDPYNNIWIIKGENLNNLKIGTSWRFIGKLETENQFIVEEFRPWPRKNLKR